MKVCVIVCGNDLGRLDKEMLPRNGQIRRHIAQGYIVVRARDSGGTLPKLLGYKGDGGELYFQICKILLM